MATKKATKKTAKKAVKKASTAGRKSKWAGKKIVKVSKENPRREGTVGHKSFSLIKSGMTYDQYIAAGGRRQDLAFDIQHKYVELRAS